MISIRPLTTAEVKKANREAKAAYWSLPIALSIGILVVATVLHWLFNNEPWEVAWWCIGGVLVIFCLTRIVMGNANKLASGAVVVERQGTVVKAVFKGNRPIHKVNIGQYVEITLEPATLEAPYPARDSFVIWRTIGMTYYTQDRLHHNYYKDMVGKTVRLTYLPDNGEVMTFDVVAHGNPLLNGEQICLREGMLSLTRTNGHNEEIALSDVDYIAVYSHRNEDPASPLFLNFRSYTQPGVSVSSLAWGFHTLEESLVKELQGFDPENYQQVKLNVGADPSVIWKRLVKENARIVHPLTAADVQHIEKGIYLEDKQQLLSWGTFSDLAAMDFVERREMSYPNPDYSGCEFIISQPTIFGLKLSELSTETPSWPQGQQLHPRWPVITYQSDIILGDGGAAGFEALIVHFSAAWGAPNVSTATEDSKEVSWTRGGTTLKLSIWKPYQSDDYSPACRLYITHEPDLTEFYMSTYTKSLTLHHQLDYTVLSGRLELPLHYITSPNTKYLPEVLKPLVPDAHKYLVWRDDKAQVIGLGNYLHAFMLPMKQVVKFIFEGNYWRDAPSGLSVYAQVSAEGELVNQFHIGTFDANESQWGAVQQDISQALGIPCTYEENRQYY